MHLMKPIEIKLDELDDHLLEIDDFGINIEKRHVNQLMERYEAKNTRALIDVNMGEDDIVQINSNQN